MSTEEMTTRLEEELVCSICLEYFRDPVSIHWGHTFCQAGITKYWHWMNKKCFHCPQCRETSPKKILKPNRELRNIAKIVPKLKEKTDEKGKTRERLSQRHQEPLKLFCKNDQMAICVVCDKSKERKGHMVFPAEEAILEYKLDFQDQLFSLKKEKQKLLKFQAENALRSKEVLKTINTEMQKTASAFKQVDQFLDEQKQLLLTQWKSLQVAAKEQQVHGATISGQISHLDSLITLAEERWLQLELEFLQEVQTTLIRLTERKLQGVSDFFPEVEERLALLKRENEVVTETLQKLEDALPCDRKKEDSSFPAPKRKWLQPSHLPTKN